MEITRKQKQWLYLTIFGVIEFIGIVCLYWVGLNFNIYIGNFGPIAIEWFVIIAAVLWPGAALLPDYQNKISPKFDWSKLL